MSKYPLRSHEDLSPYLDLLNSTYSLLKKSAKHIPSLSENPHEILQDLFSQLQNTREKALKMIKIAKKFYKAQEDNSRLNSSLVSEIHFLQLDVNKLVSDFSSQSKEIDKKNQQLDTVMLELQEIEREYRSLLIEAENLKKEVRILRERNNSPNVKTRKSLVKVQELKLEEVKALNAAVQEYRDKLIQKETEINKVNGKLKEVKNLLNCEKNHSEKNKKLVNELKSENKELMERIEELEVCLDSEKKAVYLLENEVIKEKSHSCNLVKEYERQKSAVFLGNSFSNKDSRHYIDNLNNNDKTWKVKDSQEEISKAVIENNEEKDCLSFYQKSAQKIETLGDWILEENEYFEIAKPDQALTKHPKIYVLSSPVVPYGKQFRFSLEKNLTIENCGGIDLSDFKARLAKSKIDGLQSIQNMAEKSRGITGKNGINRICNEGKVEIKVVKKLRKFHIREQEKLGIKCKERKPEDFQESNRNDFGCFERGLDIQENAGLTLEIFKGFSLSGNLGVQKMLNFSIGNCKKITIQVQVEIIEKPNKFLHLSNESLINYYPENRKLTCSIFSIFSGKKIENIIEHFTYKIECKPIPKSLILENLSSVSINQDVKTLSLKKGSKLSIRSCEFLALSSNNVSCLEIKKDLSDKNESKSSTRKVYKDKVFSLALENSIIAKGTSNTRKQIPENIQNLPDLIHSKSCALLSLCISPNLIYDNTSNIKSLNTTYLSINSIGSVSIPCKTAKKTELKLSQNNIIKAKILNITTTPLFSVFPIYRKTNFPLFNYCAEAINKKPNFLMTFASKFSIFPIHPHCKKLEISKTFNLSIEGPSCSIQNLFRINKSKLFRNSIKDFLTLTYTPFKQHSIQKDRLNQIPFNYLYKSVKKDNAHFYHWYMYLKQK